MAINLVKGQKIDLTKNDSSIKDLLIGLGWDPVEQSSGGLLKMFKGQANIDVDASVIMLRNNKFVNKKDMVYFANLRSRCGGVIHTGDNLTGQGDGDDEQIIVNLPKLPQDVNKLVFVTNIYKCVERKQHFGMIKNAFIRVANNSTGESIAKFNLSDDYRGKTALIVGEIYRYNREWKFNSIGEGTQDTTISHMLNRYK